MEIALNVSFHMSLLDFNLAPKKGIFFYLKINIICIFFKRKLFVLKYIFFIYKVLEEVFNKPINSTWTVACEPKIMDNFMLAKMHFIISVSATLYCVPEKVTRTAYCTDSDTLKKAGRISDALTKGIDK